MASSDPPNPYFNGIAYNPSFFQSATSGGLTQSQANNLYLRKTVSDTASALETFNGGIYTQTITTPTNGPITIGSTQTGSLGTISIGTNALRNGDIIIGGGNCGVVLNGYLTPQYTGSPPSGAIGYRIGPTQQGNTFAVGTGNSTLLSPSIPAGVWLIEISASFSTGTVWATISLTSTSSMDFQCCATGASAGTVRLVTVRNYATATIQNIVAAASGATTYANLYITYTRLA